MYTFSSHFTNTKFQILKPDRIFWSRLAQLSLGCDTSWKTLTHGRRFPRGNLLFSIGSIGTHNHQTHRTHSRAYGASTVTNKSTSLLPELLKKRRGRGKKSEEKKAEEEEKEQQQQSKVKATLLSLILEQFQKPGSECQWTADREGLTTGSFWSVDSFLKELFSVSFRRN